MAGTNKHFAIVVGDTGYEFVPHNGNLNQRVLLKDHCRQVGAVFIAPPSLDADTIFQINEDGLIAETPTEGLEGLSSRKGNSKGIVGQVRKPVEQLHAALFQDKFWKNPVHYKLLEPIGIDFCNKHNLSLSMAHVPKLQVMYAVSIGIIGFSHQLFKTRYGTPEQLAEIVNMVKVRLNLPNPFTMHLNWECDLTKAPNLQIPGPGWQIMTLNEWHQRNDGTFPVVVPNVPDEHESAYIDMGKCTILTLPLTVLKTSV